MERLLHATAPEPRFWAIAVRDDTITITSGPMHTPGTARHIPCKSAAAALQTAEALVAQRLKDGFQLASSPRSSTLDVEAERALLSDDLSGWLVFADSLMEGAERVRGELIALQVRAARRERGTIGLTKTFLKDHFDALVGSELGAFHKQVFLDWQFGYARTARIWSSPHSAPIPDVIGAVLQSPACRFLQRLEFGSPGGEGRYDTALRTLAKSSWPTHLDTLVLGNFDVQAAKILDSAWPRLESLASLMPVADKLRVLEIRAVLNTFGKGLRFPKLERLSLKPTALDARLVNDLQSLEVPELKHLTLSCESQPRTGWDSWARLLRQWVTLTKLESLDVRNQPLAIELLELLGDAVLKLKRLDVTGAVRAMDAERLCALAPMLRHVQLVIGDAPTLAKRIHGVFPHVDTDEVEIKKPKALPKRKRRDEDEDL